MISELRPALVSVTTFTLLLGLAYPLAMTGAAQALFSHQANGSLIARDGAVIGSELIGQSFTSDAYFHGRPSAVDYNAAGNGGSNLGPTSAALMERIAADVERIAVEGASVPVDLVTASGSGLDPHISFQAARYQAERVAAARGMDVADVLVLIERATEGRSLGLLGEPRVNVLALNLSLDEAAGRGTS